MKKWLLLFACLLCCQHAQAAGTGGTAGPPNLAGKIEFVAGEVSITHSDGSRGAANPGESILEGDLISTDGDGELHVDMTDGGVLALRPHSQIRIVHFRAVGDDDDRSEVHIDHGSLRSITGWIGKTLQSNYRITTAEATIGVRGTDHETLVIPLGATEGVPGTYEKVHAGATILRGPGGSVRVTPDTNHGFHPHGSKARPRLHAAAPASLRLARHDARLHGRHDEVVRSFGQRRDKRRREIRQSRQRRAGSA